MELKELIARGPVAMDIEAAGALVDFLTKAGVLINWQPLGKQPHDWLLYVGLEDGSATEGYYRNGEFRSLRGLGFVSPVRVWAKHPNLSQDVKGLRKKCLKCGIDGIDLSPMEKAIFEYYLDLWEEGEGSD